MRRCDVSRVGQSEQARAETLVANFGETGGRPLPLPFRASIRYGQHC